MNAALRRPEPRPLVVRDLGTVDCLEALDLQRRLVDEVAGGGAPDTLLLLEHPPVITLGRRRGAREHVIAAGDTPVVEVERGGDVTWHGPGQLVGYPVVRLDEGERDLHAFLRRLEGALVGVLAACGLEGEHREGETGVWCRGRKVASIGVAVRRWTTFHGFALNVDCDLGAFSRIRPCGLSSEVMASIASLGGRVPPPPELRALSAAEVARALDRSLL